MTNIYIASSWRNDMQQGLVHVCRAAGFEVYDFRNPGEGSVGFSWRETKDKEAPEGIPGKGSDWEPVDTYLEMINHPRAIEGFDNDFNAMKKADIFIMVLPCGKSAHWELGWAVGAHKRTAIFLEDPIEPELMYRGVDFMTYSIMDLLAWLGVED